MSSAGQIFATLFGLSGDNQQRGWQGRHHLLQIYLDTINQILRLEIRKMPQAYLNTFGYCKTKILSMMSAER